MPHWPEGVSLLLGLGAQKAGTTWLHEVLAQHPQCRAFPIKEVHYFDTIRGKTPVGLHLTNTRLAAMDRAGVNNPARSRVARLAAVFASNEPDDQTYVDIMTEGLRPGSVALDISPSYGLLDDDGYAHMAAIGPSKCVLILREPVARFWSGVRMAVSSLAETDTEFESIARQAADELLHGAPMRGPLGGSLKRTDYAQMLTRLEAAVPAHRRLVLFFETLFTQKTLDVITDFLGLSRMVLTDTRARLPGKPATMRPDQIARATEFFRPQYDAVVARFGDAVPPAWHARFAQPGHAAAC